MHLSVAQWRYSLIVLQYLDIKYNDPACLTQGLGNKTVCLCICMPVHTHVSKKTLRCTK